MHCWKRPLLGICDSGVKWNPVSFWRSHFNQFWKVKVILPQRVVLLWRTAGTCKINFSLSTPYFPLYLPLQTRPLEASFIKSAVLWLFNLDLANTLHRKTNTLDKFWFQNFFQDFFKFKMDSKDSASPHPSFILTRKYFIVSFTSIYILLSRYWNNRDLNLCLLNKYLLGGLVFKF